MYVVRKPFKVDAPPVARASRYGTLRVRDTLRKTSFSPTDDENDSLQNLVASLRGSSAFWGTNACLDRPRRFLL